MILPTSMTRNQKRFGTLCGQTTHLSESYQACTENSCCGPCTCRHSECGTSVPICLAGRSSLSSGAWAHLQGPMDYVACGAPHNRPSADVDVYVQKLECLTPDDPVTKSMP